MNEYATKQQQQVQIAHEESICCGIQKPSLMMTMSNNMMSAWQDTATTNRSINCKNKNNNDFIIPTTTPKEVENPIIKATNNTMSGNNNIVFEEVQQQQQQVPQKQQQQQVMMYSNGDCIISGMLNIRSINAYGVRKWVPHNVQIILNDNSYYQLETTLESKNKKIKKKFYSLHSNISKIEHYTKHDHAFILHINYIDKTAPVLYFSSTDTKETYDKWLSAMSLVATTTTITSKTNTSLTSNNSNSSSGTTPFLTGVIGGGPMMIERSDSRSVKRSIPSSYHPSSSTTPPSLSTNNKKREQSLLILTPEEQEVIDLALAIEASNNDIAILHSNVNDFLDTLEDE